MSMRRIVLALALSVSWSAAYAIEEVGQGYITPLATYIDPDGKLDGSDIEDGVKGGQVAFGYGFAEHWSAELALGRIHLDSNATDNNVDQDNYLFNVLNIYNRGGRFAPYLIGGVGYVDNQINARRQLTAACRRRAAWGCSPTCGSSAWRCAPRFFTAIGMAPTIISATRS